MTRKYYAQLAVPLRHPLMAVSSQLVDTHELPEYVHGPHSVASGAAEHLCDFYYI